MHHIVFVYFEKCTTYRSLAHKIRTKLFHSVCIFFGISPRHDLEAPMNHCWSKLITYKYIRDVSAAQGRFPGTTNHARSLVTHLPASWFPSWRILYQKYTIIREGRKVMSGITLDSTKMTMATLRCLRRFAAPASVCMPTTVRETARLPEATQLKSLRPGACDLVYKMKIAATDGGWVTLVWFAHCCVAEHLSMFIISCSLYPRPTFCHVWCVAYSDVKMTGGQPTWPWLSLVVIFRRVTIPTVQLHPISTSSLHRTPTVSLHAQSCYDVTASCWTRVGPNRYGNIRSHRKWRQARLAERQQWASCQIRKIPGAHAPGMPGTQVSDPDMHHGTCVTHVPWCMSGLLTSGFLWNRRRGKTFPAFPAHAQPAILRIW